MNLFIAGLGNVGGKLLAQLTTTTISCRSFAVQIKCSRNANSKKMVFNDEGIDMNNWKDDSEIGERK